MDDAYKSRGREKIQDSIDASRKGPVAGVIHTLFFGPFGCIYTSPWSAVIALFIVVALGLIYWPLIALMWVACMILAPLQVLNYNPCLRRSARYYAS